YDAGVLSASRALADYFEETARLSGAPKDAANWIANDVVALAQEHGVEPAELGLAPEQIAALIALVKNGAVSRTGAKAVLAALRGRDAEPAELVRELGLAQVDDAAEIEAWCTRAITVKANAAADVRAGEDKALGALIGAALKASGGRAKPESVRATLLRLLG